VQIEKGVLRAPVRKRVQGDCPEISASLFPSDGGQRNHSGCEELALL